MLTVDLLGVVGRWGFICTAILAGFVGVTTPVLAMMVVFATLMFHEYLRNRIVRIENSQKMMVILGSGGHTTEILKLVKHFNPGIFFPRIYVYTSKDVLSPTKAMIQEEDCDVQMENPYHRYTFEGVLRIRKVGEGFLLPLLRLPFVVLRSLRLYFWYMPDLIICNGPGVCVPICLIAAFSNFLRISSTRIVFVESICRVQTLSMTGKILIYFANDFIVQWEDLRSVCNQKYPWANVNYFGRLV